MDADKHLPDRPATEFARIEITPAMIEAGVDAMWGDPAPPAFINSLVERVYLAMERARQFETASGVSARRQ